MQQLGNNRQKKKKQHYVPRFYLEKFARQTRPEEFIILCFNKETEELYEQNTKQAAMERYFYDDGDPPVIEDKFSNFEQIHSKVYNKIINDQTIEYLTIYDKIMMCHYILIQNERTRSARIRNAQITELLFKYGEHEIELPPYDSLNDEYKDWFLESRGAMGQINIIFNPIEMDDGTVHHPYEVVRKMADLGWTLIQNDLKREFYTSDHPVFVYNPPIKKNETIRGFGIASYIGKGVEIYFPLTPRLCLVLFDINNSYYMNYPLKRQVIQKELDWINTQIIAMAHRTIFTKNNDFQFVRECINKFPELKDLNRLRL